MSKKYKYHVTLGYREEQYINYTYEIETENPIHEEMKKYKDFDELIYAHEVDDIDSFVTNIRDRFYMGDNTVSVEEIKSEAVKDGAN